MFLWVHEKTYKTKQNKDKQNIDTENGFKTCRTIKALSHPELRPGEERPFTWVKSDARPHYTARIRGAEA